ncbi:MAG: GH3 family domain-containing protein [Candidatus Helarchaeota archaeon]
MGITRIIVQKFIKDVNNFLRRDLERPGETQEKIFKQIIQRNAGTLFGGEHGFDKIRSIEDYQERCLAHKYDYFRRYIDQIFKGNFNALFNANLVCFGQTPGTTGEPKIIPIVQQSFTSVSMAQARIFGAYIEEDPVRNSRFLEGVTCFFSAYPVLRKVKIGKRYYNIGYGTGIFSYPILYNLLHIWKFILKSRVYIPIELNVMKDLEEKYRFLTKECLKRDIRCFSSTPPIILNYLEKILEYSAAEKIIDLFPNLHLLNFGGIPPIFYEKRIREVVGYPIDYREMYAATEGVIGYQMSEKPMLLTPALDALFLEFISVDDENDCRTILDIQKKKRYKLVITTFNGFYRYLIGDIIEFESIDPPLFKFIDRENSVNLMDEKMSLEQISQSMIKATDKLGVIIKEFAVVGDRKNNRYIIIIEFKEEAAQNLGLKFLKVLDENFCEINPTYKYFRKNVKTINPPELRIVKKDAFNEVEKERVDRGMPRHQLKILQASMDMNILKEFEDKVVSIENIG